MYSTQTNVWLEMYWWYNYFPWQSSKPVIVMPDQTIFIYISFYT